MVNKNCTNFRDKILDIVLNIDKTDIRKASEIKLLFKASSKEIDELVKKFKGSDNVECPHKWNDVKARVEICVKCGKIKSSDNVDNHSQQDIRDKTKVAPYSASLSQNGVPSDTLRGSKCCNAHFMANTDICSKCLEHSE